MFGFDLIVGGALFWLLVVVLFVACEVSTVNETHWGWLWLLIFGVVLTWGFHSNPFAWMLNNVGTTMIYSGIYLAIGVVWGFAKWYFHIKNAHDNIMDKEKALRDDYIAKQASTTPFNGTFTDYLTGRGYIPLASQNKEKISVWMFWWPFSVFWTMLDDVLR